MLPIQPWHMQAIVHNVHSATVNRAMCSSLLCIEVHAAQRHSYLCPDLDLVIRVSRHVVHVAVLAALRPDDAPLRHALLQLRTGAAVGWLLHCVLDFCLLTVCCCCCFDSSRWHIMWVADVCSRWWRNLDVGHKVGSWVCLDGRLHARWQLHSSCCPWWHLCIVARERCSASMRPGGCNGKTLGIVLCPCLACTPPYSARSLYQINSFDQFRYLRNPRLHKAVMT